MVGKEGVFAGGAEIRRIWDTVFAGILRPDNWIQLILIIRGFLYLWLCLLSKIDLQPEISTWGSFILGTGVQHSLT